MRPRSRALLNGSLLGLGVVIVDQLSKALVRSDVSVGERLHPLPLISVVHVENGGVAFGALGGHRWIVPLLTAVALAGVLFWFLGDPERPWAWLPAGLITGGAIGNLVDRARHGTVTDFISVPHWPAFNVSDIAITVGVIALIVVAERDARRKT